VERQIRLREASAILTGRIYDDRGNRMTPSHSNKRGVRYRYYVSHPVLQKRKQEAGSVQRVPAPELEHLVVQALRARLGNHKGSLLNINERDLLEQHLESVVVKSGAIEIRFNDQLDPAQTENDTIAPDAAINETGSLTLTLPWSASNLSAVKGVVHAPVSPELSKPRRDAALSAIAKARSWIDELSRGRVSSFAEIAAREGKVERHIRALTPLAFVSPQLIAALLAGAAPANLTVTGLANGLAYSWMEQQESHGAP
jgi:hypothetical protein